MKKTIHSSLLKISLIFLIVFCFTKNITVLAGNSNNDSDSGQSSVKTDTQNLQETNKRMVADFYQQLFGDKDITAIDRYIGDIYIQHNPSVTDGKEALKQAVSQWFKGASKEKIDIQHLGADGDFVYIHTKARMGNKIYSIVDIFRIENGKIVEHWDVMQEVPEKSLNSHPMF